ncbi:unnamed protein product [Prorocentrum cordatum]|uniref:Uncharacterized protein n=1 Tax=Prorocentrum cordatum TaxID=2364126 RepID=A0ABN9TR99_9DINO|nr:unnamed protein product [Polarella glacialis]
MPRWQRGAWCRRSVEATVCGRAWSRWRRTSGDWWYLPTFFDIVSILGGVFVNNAVWTLLDTNLILAWEYCSYDGSVGEDGWPTCAARNRAFLVVGLLILLRQRGEMDEANVKSSPIMTLAVQSVRTDRRLEEQEGVLSAHDQFLSVRGGLELDTDALAQLALTCDAEAALAEAVADAAGVAPGRVEVAVLAPAAGSGGATALEARFRVAPPPEALVRELRRLGSGAQHELDQERGAMKAQQERVKHALREAFSRGGAAEDRAGEAEAPPGGAPPSAAILGIALDELPWAHGEEGHRKGRGKGFGGGELGGGGHGWSKGGGGGRGRGGAGPGAREAWAGLRRPLLPS